MKRLSIVLLVILLFTSFIGCDIEDFPNDYIMQDSSEMPAAMPKEDLEPLQVHFLDVGQAECILIKTPEQKVILIDAGKNVHEDTVVSYIKSQGINTIDVVVGTHPHEDHIGGLDAVHRFMHGENST